MKCVKQEEKKMRTYELSLTSNYVMDWNFSMAIRELIQNGVDQQTVDPNDKFELIYEDGKLYFCNPRSYLKVNTLLLGRSSKTNNNDTVGQFGEGYKIAALVLNRLGKTFIVHNRSKEERWTSRFVNSRRWHDRILVFDVEEHKYEERGLVIEVGNVTQEEYDLLRNIWLGMHNEYGKIETHYGEILTDDSQKNQIYVNGLHISCNAEMKYGYNFLPQYLTLERDRKSCDSWDAKYLTSKMLNEAYEKGQLDNSELFGLIQDASDDASNIGYNYGKKLQQNYLEHFDKENAVDGKKPIPVTNQTEYNTVSAHGGNAVYVSSAVSYMLESAKNERISEVMQNAEENMTIYDKLQLWFNLYQAQLSLNARNDFEKILKEM